MKELNVTVRLHVGQNGSGIWTTLEFTIQCGTYWGPTAWHFLSKEFLVRVHSQQIKRVGLREVWRLLYI